MSGGLKSLQCTVFSAAKFSLTQEGGKVFFCAPVGFLSSTGTKLPKEEREKRGKRLREREESLQKQR